MKAFFYLLLVLITSKAQANITGQHLTSGQCLCVHGTHVNAHVSPGLHTTVHASLNTGECYKFHGGILTTDGYTWYQLQHVHGSENLWVAGTLLNVGTSSQCSSTSTSSGGTCHDATAKDLACKILHMHESGQIALWKQHPSNHADNAYAYNNIRDTCHGQAASRSSYSCSIDPSGAPGGHVCLSSRMLQYVYDLALKGYIHVNEVAGACHHHGSAHYSGTAVDLDPGHRGNEFISACSAHGCRPIDERSCCNHVHCQC